MSVYNKRKRNKPKFSLVWQVALFFEIGIFVTILLGHVIMRNVAYKNVKAEKQNLSANIANDIIASITEYPAYKWLFAYWIEHRDELDIEYDTEEKTIPKAEELVRNNPGLVIAIADEEEIKALSPEDQKKYAEVVYNWMLERFNLLKKAYDIEFLYCLATDANYINDVFLLSASDGSRKRGKEYGEAYVLGTEVTNTDEQRKAMMSAKENDYMLAYSGNFMDRYTYLFDAADHHIIIGNTFNIATVSTEAKDQSQLAILCFVALQLLLSVVCILLIYIYALKPLKKVQEVVYDYGDTQNSEEVYVRLMDITSKNEIGTLADCVSEMVQEIDNYVDNLQTITAEKERIGAELNIATQIQADMLPRIFPAFPENKEIDIYATMDPAKEVGGDFYDFFMVDKHHIALVMADVSGKGVPAALFMVIAKTLIKNRTLMGGTPAEILGYVNNQLCEGNTAELFVTVWMAIIDVRTGKGIAANAGHEHPALRRKGGDFELVKYRHSPAVASFEGVKFREHEFELFPGDRIFVYTDGVPEATNVHETLFGEERMLRALNRNPGASLNEMLENVKSEIDRFVDDGTQFDDITMLGFDFLGYAGDENE